MGHVYTLWFDELPEEELGRTGWKSCYADVAALFSPWKCPPAICRCRVDAGLSPALWGKIDPSDRRWNRVQQCHSFVGDLHNSSSPRGAEDAAATCLTPLAGSVPVPLISWHPAARMPSGSSLCAEQPKRIAKPNLQIPFSILFPSTNANSCNLCLNHTASAGKAGLGSRCQAVMYPVQSCWLKTF